MGVLSIITGATRSRLVLLVGLSVAIALSGCSKGGSGGLPGSAKSWIDYLSDARTERKQGKAADAEDDFQKATKQAETKFGHDSAQVSMCGIELAAMYYEEQEYRKAEKVLKDVIAINAKIGPDTADAQSAKAIMQKVRRKIRKYHLEPEPTEEKKEGGKGEDNKQKSGEAQK